MTRKRRLSWFFAGLAAWPLSIAAQTQTDSPTPEATAVPAELVTVAPVAVPTPVTLTLEECIRKALATWPSLDAADQEIEVYRAKLAQARGAYILPDVRLRVLGGPVPDVPEGNGPPTFPEFDTDPRNLGPFIQAKVEAIQPIFTFGKLSSAKKAAESGVKAKEAQKTAARNELVHRVRSVYNAAIFLESVKSFTDEMMERATSAQKRVEELLKKRSPDVTDIDLMRLQVFMAETERRVIEINVGLQLARQALGILTGGVMGPPVETAERGLKAPEITLQSIEYYLQRARTTRPEFIALENAVAARRELADVAHADFYPMLFLGGFYKYGYAPGRMHVENPFIGDDFNMSSGGVALGFEQKLSFHQTHAADRQAKAEYHKMLADQKMAVLGIELEIRKAYGDAVARRDSVVVARNGFKAGRSWVTATTLNFGVGLVPVKDLLESLVAYFKVKAGFFDTILSYENALSDLSKSVGEEVTDLKY